MYGKESRQTCGVECGSHGAAECEPECSCYSQLSASSLRDAQRTDCAEDNAWKGVAEDKLQNTSQDEQSAPEEDNRTTRQISALNHVVLQTLTLT
jgi:hypothetical protein